MGCGEISSSVCFLAPFDVAMLTSSDSMGYAFTFPFACWLAGKDISIGAYVHYPTVSADMVKRVRERSAGVENGGASKSFIRTKIKLMYAVSLCSGSQTLTG
jgi:hypothetical protein